MTTFRSLYVGLHNILDEFTTGAGAETYLKACEKLADAYGQAVLDEFRDWLSFDETTGMYTLNDNIDEAVDVMFTIALQAAGEFYAGWRTIEQQNELVVYTGVYNG